MSHYAKVEDGIVTNVIVADTKEVAEMVTGLTCIEYTNENRVSIGWTYNGSTFEQLTEGNN